MAFEFYPIFITIWLLVGTIGFFGFVTLLLMFGGLIWLQVRIWMLAKRGYHLVEHIGLNKVRTYYYLKPNDNKFDFKTGFYMHQADATTKTNTILQSTPSEFGTFKNLDKVSDEQEYKRLQEKVEKWNYSLDAVSLKWGIPIITYVGNDANPVNFTEAGKKYSAQVIKDVYIRLLATQQFNFLKKIILIGVVAMCVIGICLFLLWQLYKGQVQNTGACISAWNSTQYQLIQCINVTARVMGQNSTVFV
jgi:hypothetical protein